MVLLSILAYEYTRINFDDSSKYDDFSWHSGINEYRTDYSDDLSR